MRLWPFSKSGDTKVHRSVHAVRARFDAAQTTDDNRRHWSMADGFSADSAISPSVRETLRNRSRYEIANNSYARGIVLTLANDVIGTGPRLQMLSASAEVNAAIEQEFARWAQIVNLPEKLRTMRMARCQDGEAFVVLASNPNLASPVKLDVRLIEADQVRTPDILSLTTDLVDGIRFDSYGNPVEYQVLRSHPGSRFCFSGIGFPWAYERIPASAVVHWFRPDRPGQHRGIPEITPALPLFAMLRRYTLAVVAAAETAADFAAVLYTDSPANGESQSLEPMDVVALEKRMATVLPDGWRLGQVEAQQPTTTYQMFKHEILNEIARCMNVPFNIAAGNSSGYNYASGRLDHQTYFKSLRVDQATCASIVLDRILNAWIAEAILIPDLLPTSAEALPEHSHQWFWDGHEHVDPQKEANAQSQRLASNTTTLADEYARKGQDWETALRQRAKEVALMNELGLSVTPTQPLQPAAPANDAAQNEEPTADETEDL